MDAVALGDLEKMAKETKVPKKLVKKFGLAVLAQIRNGADAATPNSVKEALLSLGAKNLKAAGCSRAKAKTIVPQCSGKRRWAAKGPMNLRGGKKGDYTVPDSEIIALLNEHSVDSSKWSLKNNTTFRTLNAPLHTLWKRDERLHNCICYSQLRKRCKNGRLGFTLPSQGTDKCEYCVMCNKDLVIYRAIPGTQLRDDGAWDGGLVTRGPQWRSGNDAWQPGDRSGGAWWQSGNDAWQP